MRPCRGDVGLRIELTDPDKDSATMPLHPGTTIGPYTVTAKIGEGDMGEVCRVRDTKLDRDGWLQ